MVKTLECASTVGSECKLDGLRDLAGRIDLNKPNGWWRFPTEPDFVQGFMGTSLFIVGDQPSTSDWGDSNPNRRVFYDLLRQVGAGDAHLTDLYKRRDKAGSLRRALPEDFPEHVRFFREELALLKPLRVVALGRLAYQLLWDHVSEVRPNLSWMWHFAYVVRYNKKAFYENNMRLAFGPPV